MTNQEIAIRQNGALAQYVPPADDLGDFGIPDEELRPPFLRWDGKLGQITNTVTGEVMESVRLVLLRRLPASRIMWNRDLDAPDKIQCRSVDMVHPADLAQAEAVGAAATCAECPFAQFGTDAAGRATKSACSEYLNLAVVLADDDVPLPFVLAAKSTSLKPLRAAMQQLAYLAKAARSKKIPSFALMFEIRKGPLTGEGARKYFPLQAQVLSERVDPERWPELLALFQTVTQTRIEVMPEADDDGDAIDSTGRRVGDDDDLGILSGAELLRQLDAEPLARPLPAQEPDDCHSLPADGEPMSAWDAIQSRSGDPVDLPKRGRR